MSDPIAQLENVEQSEHELSEGTEVQTEVTCSSLKEMEDKIARCYYIIEDLRSRLSQQKPAEFSEEYFVDSDVAQFYSGLPTLKVMKAVYELVRKAATVSDGCKLSGFQQFMAALIKLRLNCPLQDIATRVGVSVTTVSRVWLKWLSAMVIALSELIVGPEREDLWKTMPLSSCFRTSFGTRVAVIIDCFEVFVERPSNLQARASTWSSYKHHNTVKVLLGITPQ